MNPNLIQQPVLTVLSPRFLGALAPHPSSGTIMAPSLETAETDLSHGARPITDGAVAEELQNSCLLVMEDVRSVYRSLGHDYRRLTHSLPAADPLWTISSYSPGPRGDFDGKAVFQSSDRRIVEIDLWDQFVSRVTVGYESAAAAVSQTIGIDSRYRSVGTDRYSFRAAAMPFETAVKFALIFSSMVYTSGQYEQDDELGRLQLRQGSDGSWTDLFFDGELFHLSDKPPQDGRDISFSSAKTVFVPLLPELRQPVFEVELWETGDNKKRDVLVTFHRPPHRADGVMPLNQQLTQTLWDQLLDKIRKSR